MNRIRLMAWIGEWDTFGNWQSYEAEVLSTDCTMRDCIVQSVYATSPHYVPFSALQSVALCDGPRTLQAFGRPPAASVPAWVQYAEVVA